jgi:hypothetical protein
MPIDIGNYLADITHLSIEQHGAYLLLLFQLWHRGTLPANETTLAQITRMTADAWSKSPNGVADFREGHRHHLRAQRERVHITPKRNSKCEREIDARGVLDGCISETNRSLASGNGWRRKLISPCSTPNSTSLRIRLPAIDSGSQDTNCSSLPNTLG